MLQSSEEMCPMCDLVWFIYSFILNSTTAPGSLKLHPFSNIRNMEMRYGNLTKWWKTKLRNTLKCILLTGSLLCFMPSTTCGQVLSGAAGWTCSLLVHPLSGFTCPWSQCARSRMPGLHPPRTSVAHVTTLHMFCFTEPSTYDTKKVVSTYAASSNRACKNRCKKALSCWHTNRKQWWRSTASEDF